MSKEDPTRNRYAAEQMAKTAQAWWSSRGFPSVKFWVEDCSPVSTPSGTRLPPHFEIKNNLSVDLKQLSLGNVVE
jgi:hypothetical protein